MIRIVWLVSALFISAPASAATYILQNNLNASTLPPCSGSWSLSGTVFRCSGRMTLEAGDRVEGKGALRNVSLSAGDGLDLPGNGIGDAAYTINLQSDYGTVNSSGGTVVSGNINSSSGQLNLNNTTVNGGISTNSTIISNGGLVVAGNVSAGNGVNLTGAELGGTLLATNGSINLVNGSVDGLVRSNCCNVTTNGTDLSGGAQSVSSGLSITGGTIAGDFSSPNNP